MDNPWLTNPLVATSKHDVKSLVVAVLSRQWPLSAKQLHRAIMKESTRAVTYQAVHKTVKLLEEEGVVNRSSGKYSLDRSWVRAQGEWWRNVRSRYSDSAPDLSNIPVGASVSHSFKGVISVPYWLIEQVPPLLSARDSIVELWSFGWPAQMVSEQQHSLMKRFAECNTKLVLCRSKTIFDLHCLQYLQDALGVRWMAGVPIASDCDVVAFRDYVINIYWPSAHRRVMARAQRAPSLAAGMKIAYDYVLAGEGTTLQIPVVITRNPTLASKVIEDSMKLVDQSINKRGVISSNPQLKLSGKSIP